MTEVVRYQPYTPEPKQALSLAGLLDEDFTLHGFFGGVGAGKTQMLCQASADTACTIPGAHVAIFRKTRKDVESTTYQEFLETFPYQFIVNESKTNLELTVQSCDPSIPSLISLHGLDDRLRLGSTQFTHILVDESLEIDPQDLTFLYGRLRRALPCKVLNDKDHQWRKSPYYSLRTFKHRSRLLTWCGYCGAVNGEGILAPKNNILACKSCGKPSELQICGKCGEIHVEDIIRFIYLIANPPDNDKHWLARLWKEGTLLGSPHKIRVVEAQTKDNARNLPPTYIQNLDNLPELERERLVEGKIGPGIKGPPVTPSFKKAKHVFKQHTPTTPIVCVRGWDPGWLWGVTIWMQIVAGQILVWAEDYSNEQSLSSFIKGSIKPREKTFHEDTEYIDYFDHQALNHHSPQSEHSNRDILRFHGFNPTSKASNMEKRGELIDDLFENDRLFIHEDCKYLIQAFRGGWYRDPDTNQIVKDGTYDHFGDASGIGLFCEIGAHGMKQRQRFMQPYDAWKIDPQREFEPRLAVRQRLIVQARRDFSKLGVI